MNCFKNFYKSFTFKNYIYKITKIIKIDGDMITYEYICGDRFKLKYDVGKSSSFYVYTYYNDNNLKIPEFLTKYINYTIINTGDLCLESDPCQHDVTIKDKYGKTYVIGMYGNEICKYYITRNLQIPKHFQSYEYDYEN